MSGRKSLVRIQEHMTDHCERHLIIVNISASKRNHLGLLPQRKGL